MLGLKLIHVSQTSVTVPPFPPTTTNWPRSHKSCNEPGIVVHDDVIKWKQFPRNWSLCGDFTGLGEFPTQRPVTRSFDIFFDLRLNKRLSKQPCGWWFETPSWSLWRHCNGLAGLRLMPAKGDTDEYSSLVCVAYVFYADCRLSLIASRFLYYKLMNMDMPASNILVWAGFISTRKT